MLLRKTLIFFTVVTATSFAHPGHASLWGQRVFPDDEGRFSSHAKRKVEDSGAETNDINHDTVCRTQECKQIADEFISSMNTSIDPCHDFYDFTCSGWTTNNPIPPHLPAWSRFKIFQNTVNLRIKGILETKPEPSDILPVRQAKKWFRSCMDIKTLEERGVKPIESILIQTGGWPISMDEDEWDSEEYTWQKVERNYARLTGSYTFYHVHTCPPSGENRKFGSLMITPQDLPLSEQLPLKYRNYSGDDYDEYIGLVSGIADLFAKRNQADVSKEKVIKEAKDIVEFEKKIYELRKGYKNARLTFEEFIDWSDTNVTEANEHPESKVSEHEKAKQPAHRMFGRVITNQIDTVAFHKDFATVAGWTADVRPTVRVLQSCSAPTKYPPSRNEYISPFNHVMLYTLDRTKIITPAKLKIDWRSLVQGLFDSVNIEVNPATEVLLNGLDYIKGIGELLRETPPRTVVNYIHWNFIGNMLAYTTEDLRNDLFKLVSEEYGIKKRPERWSECVDEMKMSHAAAYAFVKKYFTKQTETAVLKMIRNIQIEMDEQIERSNWLDEESKILAKDKLNSMNIFVGFPDWYNNKTAVINSYRGLNIGTEYFDNSLSYMRYASKVNLRSYAPHEEVNDPWHMDPITVDAFYIENVLNIPAVDFQSPLFTPHLPDNVNYGIAGVIVGHEMGHGFDDNGIRFGKDGNETELSENMLKNYYKRANCFIDQFNKYYGETRDPDTTEIMPNFEETVFSKSRFTWEENIADSTGIQAVFEAYRKHKKTETSFKLPGLEEFTDDQLFFVSFAGMWCEIKTPEYEQKKKKMKDQHSPAKLRVVGSVSNTKGFAEVFNCPLGSPMNPIDKCSIWGKSDVTPQTVLPKMKRKHNRWEGQWKS